jgi:non-ribosomal peptide synthetase component F
MSIEMAGAAYCPLSPRDPEQRLHTLVEQTQSHLVLIHWMTRAKFNDDIVTLDIDSILNINDIASGADYDCLSSVSVTPDSVAYVIFTSGSTGTPKAVSFPLASVVSIFKIISEIIGSSATSKFHWIDPLTA